MIILSSQKKLLIQGWRFLPHSFSVVNQFQCLSLQKQSISLAHEDRPYFRTEWKPSKTLFDPKANSQIEAIPSPSAEEYFDACYRISFPFDVTPSTYPIQGKTGIFIVLNYQTLPTNELSSHTNLPSFLNDSQRFFITPSHWSAQGLLNSGIPDTKIKIIPHGIDPFIYFAVKEESREEMKRLLGWKDKFVFLHIGAMTGNKGIPILLKAFAHVRESHPQAILVLKGNNSLYGSEHLLSETIKNLSEKERILIEGHLQYFGDDFNFSQMSMLHQAADAYVSPYHAEGFNMPVLEAMACGLPTICTAGGPTNDFCVKESCLKIESVKKSIDLNGQAGFLLEPSLDHLIHLMRHTIDNSNLRQKALTETMPWVHENYSWDRVARIMMDVLGFH